VGRWIGAHWRAEEFEVGDRSVARHVVIFTEPGDPKVVKIDMGFISCVQDGYGFAIRVLAIPRGISGPNQVS